MVNDAPVDVAIRIKDSDCPMMSRGGLPNGPIANARSGLSKCAWLHRRSLMVKPECTLTTNLAQRLLPSTSTQGALAIVNGCDCRGPQQGTEMKRCCPGFQLKSTSSSTSDMYSLPRGSIRSGKPQNDFRDFMSCVADRRCRFLIAISVVLMTRSSVTKPMDSHTL